MPPVVRWLPPSLLLLRRRRVPMRLKGDATAASAWPRKRCARTASRRLLTWARGSARARVGVRARARVRNRVGVGVGVGARVSVVRVRLTPDLALGHLEERHLLTAHADLVRVRVRVWVRVRVRVRVMQVRVKVQGFKGSGFRVRVEG